MTDELIKNIDVELINIRIKFNDLRNNAYDEFKIAKTDDDKNNVMNYIRNTFVIESNIEDDINKLKDIVWRINHTLQQHKLI